MTGRCSYCFPSPPPFLKSITNHDLKVKFPLTSSSLSLFNYEVTSNKSTADRQGRGINHSWEEPDVP